jgi:hypothetical protein
MSVDVEHLLREGMTRFTVGVGAPPGLAGAVTAARRRHRRRMAIGSAVSGTATAATAAVIAVTALAPAPSAQPGGPVHALDTGYVVRHVERALTDVHRVFQGQTASNSGPSTTWGYGKWNRLLEYTGESCGHALPTGWCSQHGGSQPFIAAGTALVAGSLTYAYVSYYNRKYSLGRGLSQPGSACSADRLGLGGPPDPVSNWSSFIGATLACGTASVTGHVRVNGLWVTRVTGKPLTVALSPAYAKSVGEKYARATWSLYVDPVSYLPLRMSGSTVTYGGPRPRSSNTSVTAVRWLPATPGNIAKAKVTIPAGFTRVTSDPGP